jgi:Derlin-2/3
MSEIWAEIRKIPSVTRFLCTASVGVSLPVMLKVLNPYSVVFLREHVTKRLELWRVPTSFFLGSKLVYYVSHTHTDTFVPGSGINYIFEIAML